MDRVVTSPRTILVCGLESSLADELIRALRSEDVNVKVQECAGPETCPYEHSTADFVFCAFSKGLKQLAEAMHPRVPVVVVTNQPEAHEWIDAMEAGASDYCAAPFEPKQIRWILEANSRHFSIAAA